MMVNGDQESYVWFEDGLPPLKLRLKSSSHHDVLKPNGILKRCLWSLEKQLNGKEYILVSQRTRVWSLASKSGVSQLPVTAAPGYPNTLFWLP